MTKFSKEKFTKNEAQYIRVGVDYFKLIQKPDRFGILRDELKKWSKDAITLDHDKKTLYTIPKYDDFIIVPDNNGGTQSVHSCYNMYHKFPHKPKKGNWKWTSLMLDHIFGEQIDAGMIYLKVMYENPKQALPILALVSKTRQTGKSTFLDWLNMLFGQNMVMIEPDVIGSTFNGEYATSNVIAIDETILDKQIAVEKIKSLATKKFISVNIKNVSQFKLPFFGKIILASNNEDKFMRIDDEEIRFWVRKIGIPKIENHNILNDMIAEIPAFLYHLKQLDEVDFTQSRMVLTAEQIANDTLKAVKEESRSGLNKELDIKLNDWFNNNSEDEFEATATDIKNRWFLNNQNITSHYITKVLLSEMNIKRADITKRYNPFADNNEWVGKAFLFERADFVDVDDIKIESVPF